VDEKTKPLRLVNCCGREFRYIIGIKPLPVMDSSGSFWLLDNIKGIKALPIMGINVPRTNHGCLESDLLYSYGFPIENQKEYFSFVSIIKQATTFWKIPVNDDGKIWWETNEKAKMDKFIYAALKQGFRVSNKKVELPKEPEIIKNIRIAMNSVAANLNDRS